MAVQVTTQVARAGQEAPALPVRPAPGTVVQETPARLEPRLLAVVELPAPNSLAAL
jgi:hypothetical protein